MQDKERRVQRYRNLVAELTNLHRLEVRPRKLVQLPFWQLEPLLPPLLPGHAHRTVDMGLLLLLLRRFEMSRVTCAGGPSGELPGGQGYRWQVRPDQGFHVSAKICRDAPNCHGGPSPPMRPLTLVARGQVSQHDTERTKRLRLHSSLQRQMLPVVARCCRALIKP